MHALIVGGLGRAVLVGRWRRWVVRLWCVLLCSGGSCCVAVWLAKREREQSDRVGACGRGVAAWDCMGFNRICGVSVIDMPLKLWLVGLTHHKIVACQTDMPQFYQRVGLTRHKISGVSARYATNLVVCSSNTPLIILVRCYFLIRH